MRANLAAFFLFGSCAIIVVLAPAGYVGIEQLKLVAVTFPGVLVGFWLSGFVVNRLSFAAFRSIVLPVAALAGLSALVLGLLVYLLPLCPRLLHHNSHFTIDFSLPAS